MAYSICPKCGASMHWRFCFLTIKELEEEEKQLKKNPPLCYCCWKKQKETYEKNGS